MNSRKLSRVVFGGLVFWLSWSLLLPGRTITAQTASPQRLSGPERNLSPLTASGTSAEEEALIKATAEYKTSLKELLVLREERVRLAVTRRDRFIRLRADGLISKLELEEAEREVLEAQSAAEEVGKQLGAADIFLAESLAEKEITAAGPESPPSPPRKSVRRSSNIRFTGFNNWSLSGVAGVEIFFLTKFGRKLPVSTIGQSALHNRWCWDHRNSVDVGVNPDRPEGQALMSFLRSAGIPFLAFRSAVPGSSTGPHIHIGFPSRRITNCTPAP